MDGFSCINMSRKVASRSMQSKIQTFLLLVLSSTVWYTDGQTLNQSIELMNEKLTGYDRRHRPIENQSLAIQVNVSFDLIAVQTVDEVNSLFSVVGIVYLSWYDSRIVWDPSSYGGISSQLYKPSDVWYPVLVLANPYDSLTDIANNSTNVRVYPNGLAVFVPGSVFRTTCSADVRYYPFDTQTCNIRLIPWGYLPEEMTLYSPLSDVQQNYYSGNGEWNIVTTKAYHDAVNTIWFSFTLRRKPLFLVINILLPIMFLAFINALVFLLPCESGERVSYSITVLLSIAVFLTLVGDNLPKTSEPMSVLCYYMMLILVLSTLICLVVILNMSLFFCKRQDEVAPWGATLVSALKCRCNYSSKNKVSGDTTTTRELVQGVFANFQMPQAQISHDKDKVVTWKEVSLAVDKICLTVFFGTNVLLAVVFIGVLVGNDV